MGRTRLVVVDEFLSDPNVVREFALSQTFNVSGNYPGTRTDSFATESLRDAIQTHLAPYGKIVHFPIGGENGSNYNGAYQYTTSRDRSWIHTDSRNNWAGVLYLTPEAPASSGTGFFRHRQTGVSTSKEAKHVGCIDLLNDHSQDVTRWEKVAEVGNVFNRLVLFDADQWHTSLDYFGSDKYTGRLFQTFFFSIE